MGFGRTAVLRPSGGIKMHKNAMFALGLGMLMLIGGFADTVVNLLSDYEGANAKDDAASDYLNADTTNARGNGIATWSPTGINLTLNQGENATETITIFNIGTEELGWNATLNTTGSGTPTKIAIFQSNNPWGYTANQDVCNLYSIPYSIFGQSAIGVTDLSQFDKVIITIGGDTQQTFVDAVIANRAWFEAYAASGKVLEIHAAPYTSINIGGPMPGNFVLTDDAADLVSIADNTHVLIHNPVEMTDPMFDNWGSSYHETITSMPAWAHVILAETTSPYYPILVEERWGAGTIFITTQAIEHAYSTGDTLFLRNLILYKPVVEASFGAVYVAPSNGTIAPSSSQNVDFTFETADLSPGTYLFNISIITNDTSYTVIRIPVNLTVRAPLWDVSVESIFSPAFVDIGDTTFINATVRNRGSNDISNVLINFTVNGTFEASLTIPTLAANTSTNLTFYWTPTIMGNYTLGIDAAIFTGENITTNNFKAQNVTVKDYPHAWWTPSALDVTLETNTTALYNITLGNTGVPGLNFMIYNQTGIFTKELINDTFPTATLNTTNWASLTGEITTNGANEPSGSYSVQINSGDTLTSNIMPITRNATLSFFWQRGGYGEAPDAGEYLWLEFYTAQGSWMTLWRVEGTGFVDSTYYYASVNFPSNASHPNFRFRFNTSGSGSTFDDFFVDNVVLRVNSTFEINPTSGTIASGMSQDMTVNITSFGLAPGIYNYSIEISTDDPMNATIVIPVKLTVTKPKHDIAVASFVSPSPTEIGFPSWAIINISNLGLNDESNIVVSMYVDGALDSMITIPSLLVGETTILNLTWTPASVGNHTLRVDIMPLVGENVTANNYRQINVTVRAYPEAWWSPASFNVTLEQNTTTICNLTIGNTGLAGLNFSVMNAAGTLSNELFNETFPSLTLNTTNWPYIVNSPTITTMGDAEPSGPYSLDLDGSPDTITSREINLTGMTNVTLSFYYERGGSGEMPDTDDYIVLEYYSSSGLWTNLMYLYGVTVSEHTFTYKNYTLPADALHQNFRFRFWSSGDGSAWDDFFIDDILIKCNNKLSVAPLAGIVPSGTTQDVAINVSAVDVMPGTYNFSVAISTDDPENATIVVPITLTVTKPKHDIGIVSFASPSPIEIGLPSWAVVNVSNMGLNDENNVIVNFYIDGILSGTNTIPTLTMNAFTTLNFTWTPMTAGNHTLRLEIVPISGENATLNNYRNMNVTSRAMPHAWWSPTQLNVTLSAGDYTTETITIGNSGSGTLGWSYGFGNLSGGMPTRVAIFQNTNPWALASNQNILTSHGIPYTVFGTASIGTADLSSYDKIIICYGSDQGTTFMNAVSNNRAWFEAYVASGKVLEMHIAPYTSVTIVDPLPCGVATDKLEGTYVSIASPGHTVLTNPNVITDTAIDFLDAYLENISAMPAGALTILRETNYGMRPVLAEAPWGMGAVLVTTMPLEWAWMNNGLTLLENLLLYKPIYTSNLGITSVTPLNGTIAPSSSAIISLTFDSTNVSIGTHHYNITISTNDTSNPYISIPVNLTVLPPQRDICVSSIYSPSPTECGMMTFINATVSNVGLNTITGITVNLTINGAVVNSVYIASLAPSVSTNVTFTWTPTFVGNYSVGIETSTFAGENITSNNNKTQVVRVIEVPHAWWNPVSLSVTLHQGENITEPVTIGNSGSGGLGWNISLINVNDKPTHVAVFQVDTPWYTTTTDILSAYSIPYTIYGESAIGTVDLSQYDKVVLVLSDSQPQSFKNAILANSAWFNNYVSAGGVLEIHAAPQDNLTTGPLPGGFYFYYRTGNYATIVDGANQMINSPHTMTNSSIDSWSSTYHAFIPFLPAGAHAVITEDAYNYPILAEMHYGLGAIIMTTMTVEHAYYYAGCHLAENMLLYMPRISSGSVFIGTTPLNGTIPPSSSNVISVVINSTGLAPGNYNLNLTITTNDTANPYITIPVNLTVLPPFIDVSVDNMTVPSSVEAGTPATINATIGNHGMTGLTNVVVNLLVDGAVVDSTTVPSIASFASTNVSFAWTPTIAGTYNVSVEAAFVAGENITTNNRLTKPITVNAYAHAWWAPSSFDLTLETNSTAPCTFMLGNTGGLPLNYTAYEVVINETFPTTTLNTAYWSLMTGSVTINTDGINEPSSPYSANFDGSYDNDALYSPVYNLAGNQSPSISFYYQMGGYGEAPDSDNPFELQFYTAEGTWYTVWRVVGDSTLHTDWVYVNLTFPANATHSNFRFRFRSFGDGTDFDDFFLDNVVFSCVDHISVVPPTGTIGYGSLSAITFMVNSLGLSPGYYQFYQNVTTNDLANPSIAVLVNLTVVAPAHDVAVTSIYSPSPGRINHASYVAGMVSNFGLGNETALSVSLYVNGVFVDETTIASLAPGASAPVNFSWTPTALGTYTVRIEVAPVLSENYFGNNHIECSVSVPAQPEVWYSPSAVNITVGVNGVASMQMLIGNTGMAPLGYTFNSMYPIDDFEDGVLDGWQVGGASSWITTTSNHHNGTRAAMNGNVSDNEYSYIRRTVSGPATLTFYWACDSQWGDNLNFYIDGILMDYLWGTVGWTLETYTIPAGNHVIMWNYSKDGAGSSASDCGWIDDISIIQASPVSWLSISPVSGSVLPSGSASATFSFNASGLLPGYYTAMVRLTTNDSFMPVAYIPVNMTVVHTYDVAVASITAQTPVMVGDLAMINATIRNLGSASLPSILVNLSIDGVVVNSTTISSLASGSSANVIFFWQPSTSGMFDVAIIASIPQAETSYANNVKTSYIQAIIPSANLPPIIDTVTPPSPVTVNYNAMVTFAITAHDPEAGSLSFAWQLDAVDQGNFAMSHLFSAITVTPGTHTLTVFVTDNASQTVSFEWTVIVLPNHAPTIDGQTPASPVAVNEGGVINMQTFAHDEDGDALTYSWFINGTLAGTGSTYAFVTNYNSAGTYTVQCTVSDGNLNASTQWSVNVLNVNRPPTIISRIPSYTYPTMYEGDMMTLSVTATDPDGDSIIYSWFLDGVLFDTGNSSISYCPDFESAGGHTIVCYVSDGTLQTSTYWSLTVYNMNGPPVLYPIPSTNPTMYAGTNLTFSSGAVDPDGDALNYTWRVDGVIVAYSTTFDYLPSIVSVGTHVVNVTVCDSYGASHNVYHEWSVNVIYVDTLVIGVVTYSPVTPYTLTIVTVNASIYSNATISAWINYTFDNVIWQSSAMTQVGENWTGTIPPTGMPLAVRFFIHATDTAGRTADSLIQQYMSVPTPTGGLNVTINGGAEYTNTTAVQLTISCPGAQVGVWDMCFSTDGVNWTGWTPYQTSVAFDLPAGEGMKLVVCQVRDTTLAVRTAADVITFDASPPTTILAPNGTEGNLGWYVSDVRLVFSATDSTSGVAHTYYRIDGGNWYEYMTATLVSISSSGTHTVEYYSVDLAGNTETANSLVVRLDRIAPIISSLTFNGASAFVNSTTVVVAINATDVHSGMNQLSYSLDNATWSAWSSFAPTTTITVSSGEGLKLVYFRFTDNAGNMISLARTIYMDNGLPTTNESHNGTMGQNGWYVSEVRVNFTATDAYSGINATYYSIDGGAWQTNFTFVLYADGAHVIRYYSVDEAGNKEAEKSVNIWIDRNAPAQLSVIPESNSVNKTSVSVSISATDAGSGGIMVQVYVDGAQQLAWMDMPSSVTVTLPPTTGLHSVTVSFRDLAGNVASLTASVMLDNSAPTTTTSIEGKKGSDGKYIGTVVVKFSASETQCKIFYRVDGGAWTEGVRVNVSKAGAHKVEAYSIDAAGNKGAIQVDKFTIASATSGIDTMTGVIIAAVVFAIIAMLLLLLFLKRKKPAPAAASDVVQPPAEMPPSPPATPPDYPSSPPPPAPAPPPPPGLAGINAQSYHPEQDKSQSYTGERSDQGLSYGNAQNAQSYGSPQSPDPKNALQSKVQESEIKSGDVTTR